MVTPNTYGVYDWDERLSLPRPKASFRGCNLADIKVVDLGPHWLWAVDFQMWSGNMLGQGHPLKDYERYRAASRDAAIEAAMIHLRDRMARIADEYPDARLVLAWLDDLRPTQADLFGLAA